MPKQKSEHSQPYRSPSVHESPQQPRVVVVHCSDPRYQPHFQDFLKAGRRLDRYGLIAIPGGVHTLTLVDRLPEYRRAGWRWLEFLTKVTQPERVILIAHADCRWYVDNRFEPDMQRLRLRQVEDLERARVAIIERFNGLRVETYYTTLGSDGAVFEAI
jgi:hypothetical protein